MTYTESTSVFLADGEGQDVSETLWVAVLERAGSFDADALWLPFARSERPQAARQLYRIVTDARQRASYWLAKPFEEHSAGKNQNSVLWRGQTRSWGNATSVRLKDLRGWTMYFDEFRGRAYVRYANVIDSIKDALFRITDPTFVYVQENRRTVRQVGERFVGLSENTDDYVNGLVRRMNEYVAMDTGDPMTAQVPGFTWYPADANHYNRGRTQKVRGGAQHYTAGTNSLNWLAKTSEPEVSVHFLVKHDPTLADRGWQLVAIENTAWTTASANPYTVAIEYEHRANQTIPDIAYEVLAVTWVEIDRYCKEHGIGEIAEIKGHKEWVNNPQLICPDGIDVERIRRRVKELTAPPPEKRTFPETGASLAWGFKGFFERLEAAGLAFLVLGYPLADERGVKGIPGVATAQRFERGWLVYEPGNAAPWDVHVSTVEQAIKLEEDFSQ